MPFAAPNEPLLAGARISNTVLGSVLAFGIAFFLRVRPGKESAEKQEKNESLTA